MNGLARILLMVLMASSISVASEREAVVESVQAKQDVALDLNPSSSFWLGSHPVFMQKDNFGKTVPRYRTEVRTRWTKDNLYFLFVCPYEQLNLKPSPDPKNETNELWNWDVAEVFLGSDFSDIKRYKEFEISPQGEWIDLDIDLKKPHHEDGWTWNSGFEVKARIDQTAKVWYGAMRIPMSAIDSRPAKAGNTLRMNLFRSQGPAEHQQAVTWQAPMNKTFHTPERFGLIRLVDKK